MSIRSRGDKPKSCSLESLAISRGIIESPTSKHPLVERLRQELASRGTDGFGFSDFQKRLNILDRDESRTVNLEQVKIAFQHCSLNFNDQEISTLFYFFENCGKAYIDIDEFILGIRGPLSFKRRELVERVLQQFDATGDGVLSPEDVIDRFDPTEHPDVKSGSKKAQDVFREFLRSFEVGGEIEGKITRREFLNYYHNVSASIEHDDYFEVMLRHAWHIAGSVAGAGAGAGRGNGNTIGESLDFSPPRRFENSFSSQQISRGNMSNTYDDRYSDQTGPRQLYNGNNNEIYDRDPSRDRRLGPSGNHQNSNIRQDRNQKI